MTEEGHAREVGFIIEATQYVLTLTGLPSVHVGDIIAHEETGERAIVRSFTEDTVIALALDP